MTTQSLSTALPGLGSVRPSATRIWSGRALTALAVLFLIMDGGMKLMNIAPVREAMAQLGYPIGQAPAIGLLLLLCVTVYLVPRTAVLGAILLTGFLGGAIGAQVRVGNPLLSHALFPVYVALMLWGGLYLREDRLRALIPLRKER